MIICATGHRPHKLGKEYNLKGPYSKYIYESMKEFIKKHQPYRLISGMALGVDQLWAIAGIRLKHKVLAAVPFAGQELAWPQTSQTLYRTILRNDFVTAEIISKGKYSARKMQVRNEWMVDKSDLVFAVWDGSNGGTKNCIDYAKSINKEVFVLDPNDWK